MAVSWSKGEKCSLNRGEYEKIQGKVNNQDLGSGNYSRIQTQLPEAVYDLGCFSAKWKSMGVREGLNLDHTCSRRAHCQALSGWMTPSPFASLYQHFSTKKEKKEIKTCWSALFKLCFLFYLKNSCALQNILLYFNASESTLPELVTSAYLESRESSRYTTNQLQRYKEK